MKTRLTALAAIVAILAIAALVYFSTREKPASESAMVAPAPQAQAPSADPAMPPPPEAGSKDYPYSALYRRVDLSFSAIAIDTRFGKVKGGMRKVPSEACQRDIECEWADRGGVQHSFWAGDEDYDNRDSDVVVIKFVQAANFRDRPIGALGIGLARDKAEVLAKVRAFAPEIKIECEAPDENGELGYEECGGTVDPGWFRIGFDKQGKLTQVRFDGYRFT